MKETDIKYQIEIPDESLTIQNIYSNDQTKVSLNNNSNSNSNNNNNNKQHQPCKLKSIIDLVASYVAADGEAFEQVCHIYIFIIYIIAIIITMQYNTIS